MKFLVINGPNLNLTQFTEPGMEGQIDFNTLLDYIEAGCAQMDVQVDFFQSNHEGDLIDEIQSAAGRADGIILNPGGYAYYSVAILEALQVCGVPAVEVMLADPSGKEPFRSVDVVSFGCQGRFAGEGVSGYLHARLPCAAAPAGWRRADAPGAVTTLSVSHSLASSPEGGALGK